MINLCHCVKHFTENSKDVLEPLIPVFVTALIGLLGWYFLELRANYLIRKSITTFLQKVIKPVVLNLKDKSENGEKSQIDKVIDFVDLSKGDQYLVTGHFPLFNSNFLKSFPMNTLRIAYKNDTRFLALMNVIGYLDGFENRMPNDYQQQWNDFIKIHKKECETDIMYCEAVKHQTILFQKNLELTKEMAEKLLLEINKVIKHESSQGS